MKDSIKGNPWTELNVLALVSLLLFMPGRWVIVGVFSRFMPFVVAFALYAGLFLYVGHRSAAWPCPRCGKPFHRNVKNGKYGLVTVVRLGCPNCGLRRGESISPESR